MPLGRHRPLPLPETCSIAQNLADYHRDVLEKGGGKGQMKRINGIIGALPFSST